MSDPNGRAGLTPGNKIAWALLVVAVASLMGFAFWKKTRVIEPNLSGSGQTIILGGSKNLGPNGLASGSDAPKPEELAVSGRVTDFSFTDQHGKTVTAKDLRGEVWVATFIFTHCAGTCPLITHHLSDLDKELADLPSVKLISFSMDPDNDTPEVLNKYAISQEAVSPRWHFLTGAKSEMYRLTRDDFKLVVDDKQGTPSEPIIHSSKIVLVDAQGYIRGRFDAMGMDGPKPESVKLLGNAIRKLRTLPPVVQTASAKENK